MDEVCQMIEGKLSSIDHEPSGVQIVFEPSGAMALHEDGEFIREEPEGNHTTMTLVKVRSSMVCYRKRTNR